MLAACTIHRIECVPLSLDEYPKWLSEHNASLTNNANTAIKNTNNQDISNKERKKLEAAQRQKTAPLRKKIKQLEDNMQKISDKQSVINQQLSDSDIYAEKNKQKLEAERMVGGEIPTGQTPVVKEETPEEYRARVLAGGLDVKKE